MAKSWQEMRAAIFSNLPKIKGGGRVILQADCGLDIGVGALDGRSVLQVIKFDKPVARVEYDAIQDTVGVTELQSGVVGVRFKESDIECLHIILGYFPKIGTRDLRTINKVVGQMV